MVPKVKIFKLHELWASSRNGCFYLQLKSKREIRKQNITYKHNMAAPYCNKIDITSHMVPYLDKVDKREINTKILDVV